MTFWLLVTLMILVTLAVIAWPLLRRSRQAGDNSESINLSVYRQQIRELEADHQRGLVTGDQMEQARRDIERALLDEVPEQPPDIRSGMDQREWLPAALVVVLIIGLSLPVYLTIGYPDSLKPGTPNGMPSPQEMVARLENRLEQNPEDPRGWQMLARSYMVLERYEDAAGALEELRGLIGDEPGLMVRYANALAQARGGSFEGRPLEVIHEVLDQDPDYASAVWFAGLAANQRGDYQQAVEYWERLAPKLEDEPEAQQRLNEMIAKARAAMETGDQ